MQILTLPSATITVHDSPRTLPESRRVECDYYSLIESSVGSTQDDIDRHFEVMAGLVGCDDPNAQLTAINNTRFLFANLLGKQYSARSLAFCCLVEKIDDKPWEDYSPEGIEELARVLSAKGLTDELLLQTWGPVKKKLYSELTQFDPERFPDMEEPNFILQQKALLIELDSLIDPDDPALAYQIDALNQEIQESIKPAQLTGPNNQLEIIRESYVSNKIAMQMEGLPVDDKTSTIAFWQYVKALEAKYKRNTPTNHELVE
ncbi:hypothetical protein [Spirosoma foliorum]|uniref:Uncharacterized protein n=1 Tax=Spirosoma foliorum TaxID=2710596 RepID=A0A7G5H5H9_9BACT|nr:hypothetical protein [Spirosoma foliorum]QMW06371.1 hypothetical protein H3H32_16510 [Spirosoma foliorum]